jgi:hypothetical protein
MGPGQRSQVRIEGTDLRTAAVVVAASGNSIKGVVVIFSCVGTAMVLSASQAARMHRFGRNSQGHGSGCAHQQQNQQQPSNCPIHQPA